MAATKGRLAVGSKARLHEARGVAVQRLEVGVVLLEVTRDGIKEDLLGRARIRRPMPEDGWPAALLQEHVVLRGCCASSASSSARSPRLCCNNACCNAK